MRSWNRGACRSSVTEHMPCREKDPCSLFGIFWLGRKPFFLSETLELCRQFGTSCGGLPNFHTVRLMLLTGLFYSGIKSFPRTGFCPVPFFDLINMAKYKLFPANLLFAVDWWWPYVKVVFKTFFNCTESPNHHWGHWDYNSNSSSSHTVVNQTFLNNVDLGCFGGPSRIWDLEA